MKLPQAVVVTTLSFMTSRTLASLLAACILAPLTATLVAQEAEEPPPLVGRIQEKTYISPTGMFKVEIPVLPELGGVITDTENVVTFQDSFNVHASIACFAMDATQRWLHETRGRKDYLIGFFTEVVHADFVQRFPGASIESAKFRASLQDGALFTFTLLPGGSMFGEHVIVAPSEEPPVAKRGNLLFVRDEHVFIISTELAEKVLERSTWNKKTAEEDEMLTKRLLDLLSKITFTPPKRSDK